MKNVAFLLLFFVGLTFLSACSVQKISDVKNDDLVGEKVTVRGIVDSTIKIGSISGYVLSDDSGTIAVSSESLPVEGKELTVSGVLIKDTLFGYYIKVND
ncbi:MAG: hypothetical protein ACP5NV_05910 [Candidatus Woesearchaeota archaeon]